MCAEYNLKTSEAELNQLLQSPLLNESNPHMERWQAHIRLYGSAPVLRKRQGKLILEQMKFSFLPPGSRIAFTANTRLDDWDERFDKLTYAFERPTWREAFLQRRCVVPVSEFLEPIYWGRFAGQMVGFSAPQTPTLLVAAIFQETVDQKTGEIYGGFSLLTDFAYPHVHEVGHHRSVLILNPAAALQWMQERPVNGPEAVRFLLRNKQPLDLQARAVREMKNWRARVKNAETKFAEEERVRTRVEAERRRLGLF